MGQAVPQSVLEPDVELDAFGEAGTVRMSDLTDQDIADRLRTGGIALTLQRLVIARVLLSRPIHLTADQVWARARVIMPEISRATVYNTLDLFERSTLWRRIKSLGLRL